MQARREAQARAKRERAIETSTNARSLKIGRSHQEND
jgi:hypothetical protein